MASNKLNETAIRRMKFRTQSYRVADGEGLYLQIEPNGSRYWRMAYRFGGKQKTLAFGIWPDVDLIAARKKREAAKDELRAGRDPGGSFTGTRRPTKRVSADGPTFGQVVSEVLAKMEREQMAAATLAKTRWLLQDLAAPLKDEPLDALDAPTIQTLLEGIEKSGRYESAIRLRGAIGRVFRHAIRTARASADPTAALAGGLTQPPAQHLAAVIAPKAVGRLLLAIDSFDGAPTVGLALKLAPYLFVRPGELRGMEWAEFDRRARVWVIPAERTKQRREHVVPLAPQALALFAELHKLTGGGVYAFPNGRTAMKCMSEGTLAAALASIGYSPDVHTPHGFRSTASTMLHGSRQFPAEVVEMQMAHKPKDRIRAIYDRNLYLDERAAMMRWYANHLDSLRDRARQNARFGIEA